MNERNFNRTWVEIDLDKLQRNVIRIRELLPGTKIAGVVKADAYGHGVGKVSKTIAEYCDTFAVSSIDEALQLRSFNKDKPILILGYTPVEAAELLCDNGITQTVFSYDYATALANAVEKANKKLKIHIKLDTGMSRLGFNLQTEELFEASKTEILRAYAELSDRLIFEGIFTHFAVSDDKHSDFTQQQFDTFIAFTEALEKNGLHFDIRHVCNSAAILNYPQMKLDMVRPGIILYGLYPDPSCTEIGLESVLSLKTVVAQTRKISKGMTVSYGRTFSAEKDMVTATVPIGYADGFARLLSDNGEVLINGKRASVIGRVCMDQCIVDVTDIENVTTGTTVTIIGKDGAEEITASDIAAKTGTINYEITCVIGKRVPRVYMKDGKEISRHIDINP